MARSCVARSRFAVLVVFFLRLQRIKIPPAIAISTTGIVTPTLIAVWLGDFLAFSSARCEVDMLGVAGSEVAIAIAIDVVLVMDETWISVVDEEAIIAGRV